MKELMIMMASVLDTPTHVDQIMDAVLAYKADPTEKNTKMLTLVCSMFLTKVNLEQKGQEPHEMIEELNNLSNLNRVFKEKN